jgi:hypothetical protein
MDGHVRVPTARALKTGRFLCQSCVFQRMVSNTRLMEDPGMSYKGSSWKLMSSARPLTVVVVFNSGSVPSVQLRSTDFVPDLKRNLLFDVI